MPWVIDEKTGQRTWKPETPQVEGITPPEAEKKYIATEGGVQKAKAPASGRYQRAGFVGAGQRTELREKEKSRMLALQNLATKGRMFTQRFSNMFQDVPKMSEEDEQIFKVETPGALTGEKFIEMAKEPLYGTEAKERFTSQRETEAKEAGNIVTDIETGFGTEKTEQERQYKAYLKSIGEAPDEVSLEGLSGARRLGALREIARKGVIGETGALGELEKIANIGQGEIDQLDQRSIDRINELKTNLKTDLKTQYGETLGVLGGTAKQSFDNLVDRLSDYTEGLGDINQIGTELTNQDSLISTLFTDIKTQQGLTGGYEGVLDTLAKVNAGRDFEIANINKDILAESVKIQNKRTEMSIVEQDANVLYKEIKELENLVKPSFGQRAPIIDQVKNKAQSLATTYFWNNTNKVASALKQVGILRESSYLTKYPGTNLLTNEIPLSKYLDIISKDPKSIVGMAVVPKGTVLPADNATRSLTTQHDFCRLNLKNNEVLYIPQVYMEGAMNIYAAENKTSMKSKLAEQVPGIDIKDLKFDDGKLYARAVPGIFSSFNISARNNLDVMGEMYAKKLQGDLDSKVEKRNLLIGDTPETDSKRTQLSKEISGYKTEKNKLQGDISTITSAIEKFATDLEAKKTTKTGLGTERTSIQDTLAKIARGEEGVTYADRSIEDILAGK